MSALPLPTPFAPATLVHARAAHETSVPHDGGFHGIVGRSPRMQALFTSIRRLAPHARSILVTGETGTGKELVARALHACGPRARRKLVTMNCSAVVETLFESELFGHARGAFTGATSHTVGLFEHADGGTLFLDEVGELPLSLQPKLLRALEYGEVQRVGSLETRRADVCIIAATNGDLQARVSAGRFRGDLYYRLGTIEIHLPALRERREDIPDLTARFIREFADRLRRPITGVSPAAAKRLQDAAWPGNIRELRSVLEHACILSDRSVLSERDVTAAMRVPPAETAAAPDPSLLRTAQRGQIGRVLAECGGNKTAAAKALGVSRRSLYRWVERFAL